MKVLKIICTLSTIGVSFCLNVDGMEKSTAQKPAGRVDYFPDHKESARSNFALTDTRDLRSGYSEDFRDEDYQSYDPTIEGQIDGDSWQSDNTLID